MAKLKGFVITSLVLIGFASSAYHSLGLVKDEVACLNDLPMSELLRIRRAVDLLSCPKTQTASQLQPIAEAHTSGNDVQEGRSFSALPLIGHHFNPHRSQSGGDPWNEKPSKLQNVFQLSITALSFLAFGGYLLCMIVQAIKSKGTTYYHTSAMMTSTGNGNVNGSPLKKIKVYRRSKRQLHNSTEASPAPDELYKVLLSVAESYVKISTISK